MRRKGDAYEYIACYVDDLVFCMKNPQELINYFTNICEFKLKGTGKISFHIRCDFNRDEDGLLCMQPVKYIERIIENHKGVIRESPSTGVSSPLEKGDHTELDTSSLLDPDDIEKYQSIVGLVQWAVSLGRMDIATTVMTLSSYKFAPRGTYDENKKSHWLSGKNKTFCYPP